MAGASLEDAIDDSAEDTSETTELTADSAEETAEETADETAGASDEDGAGASLELTTAELDGATGTTGVGVPRLKIQIRPMITITATIMIIQVLRFIRALPCVGGDETGKLFLC
jgi:hypothetical protein